MNSPGMPQAPMPQPGQYNPWMAQTKKPSFTGG
jgi:hypothetical protein